MASATDEIPMPTGWERKYDSSSNRTYYIDHARRVTQWDDPRLRHPSIWKEAQRQMLDRLSLIFKDAPEDTLRQALITTKFMEFNAVNHVTNLGYKKSASIIVGQPTPTGDFPATPSNQPKRTTSQQVANGDFSTLSSQTQQARRTSSPKQRTKSSTTSPKVPAYRGSVSGAQVDPFTLMTLKGRFPETTEDVIVDVLNQCGQNMDMASRELTNMGYAGRQRAQDRKTEQVHKMDEEKEKLKRLKSDRDQHLRQLKNEFEAFLDADISNTFETCKYDLYEARSALRLREADVRMQALDANAKEVQVTAVVPALHVEESITETTFGDTVVTIERRIPSSENLQENFMKETVTIRPAKAKPPKQSKKPKLPKTEIIFMPAVSKSTEATPAHRSTADGWTSLAKGPNPSFRHGSDPHLRSRSTLALGPDPSLRQGPNPELRLSFAGY